MKDFLEFFWGDSIGKDKCSCKSLQTDREYMACDNCHEVTRGYTSGIVTDRNYKCKGFILCDACNAKKFK